ncbi:MAG TPA: hypothetical protein ENL00_04120, partial [Nitratifractor sp.]|nr:hypothetical protein [Nitratifractor sp.]
FSFFVYGEIFFLSGSILAGMGILNIWILIAVLYAGGIVGDNISYFLGRKYGIAFYYSLRKRRPFNRLINRNSFNRGSRFFRKYGAVSVFFGRLLGPISWITPFIVGTYRLEYKKFLPYEILGVVVGIGQFIIVGYLFGKHFETVLQLLETYIFVAIFATVALFGLYYYLKKKKIIQKWRQILKEDRKKLLNHMVKDSFFYLSTILALYLLFLFYIFFIDDTNEQMAIKKSYSISMASTITDCKKNGLYYADANKTVVQPLNIRLNTTLTIKDIVDGSWDKNKIFRQNHISFTEYIHLLKEKVPPVSSLYYKDLPQNYAYQYKTNSLAKREHIRFWEFKYKQTKLKTYYASISYDDGYRFSFYNYFITPVHKIDRNIDKSREFFYNYLKSRRDLSVKCSYLQTKCIIKEIKGDNEPSEEQRFYTDGKILDCNISKR